MRDCLCLQRATLGDSGRDELDAVFLPPASQGDVYRAAVKRPAAIGIIDGRFHDTPAVWHKEILWARPADLGDGSEETLQLATLAAP